MDVLLQPILLFGIAAGVFVATAIGLVMGPERSFVRWIGFAFLLSAASHGIDKLPGLDGVSHPVIPAWLLSCSAAGLMWAFVQALFTDRSAWTWAWVAPGALTALLAILGAILPAPFYGWSWLAYNGVVIALMAHAGWVIWSGRAGDLVEARRRLRTPMIVAGIVYIVVVQFTDLSDLLGARVSIDQSVQGLALVALSLGAAGVLLRADPLLVAGKAPAPSKPPVASDEGIDPADRALAMRLEKAMQEEAIWKREDLTIGALAAHLKTPEHRLRHLINTQLGHRNFAAFVNARRIEAAKAALADPDHSRTPVSAIAYDLGFASLGPFNRAFKDATGKTPTEWRAEHLRATSDTPGPSLS